MDGWQTIVFAISIGPARGRSQPCTAPWTANEINGTRVQDKHANPRGENAARRVGALAFVEANREPGNEYRKPESPHPAPDVIANGHGARYYAWWSATQLGKDSRDEQLEVIRVATDRFEGAANYPTESGLNAKRADRMGWKSASSMSS